MPACRASSTSTDPEAHPPVAVVLGDRRPGQPGRHRNPRRLRWCNRVGDVSYVDSAEGSVTLDRAAALPGAGRARTPPKARCIAPLPGAVGRVLVVPGQRVAAGELLLTLEAMKMEHAVHAPAAGVVASLPVSAGAQVDTGTVLAVITPD